MAFSINDLNYEKDSKERMPWEHYTEEFAEGRPGRNCRDGFLLPYDEETERTDSEISGNACIIFPGRIFR